MQIKKRFLSKLQSESFLIGILRLIGLLSLYNDSDHYTRGRPYVYPTTVMIRCFVVRVWMRIPSTNALHYYFSLGTKRNQKIMKACGMHTLPDRRTFDRRFKIIPIRQIIANMGSVFLSEKLVDDATASLDSSLLKARGPVWHKSDMKKNRIPVSGIDTDARWGFSKTKGWVFGYKLHMTCSAGRLVVPLSADFSTANIADNQMYESLVYPLAGWLENIIADPAYDDGKLYQSSKENNLRLVCPIKAYDGTPPGRLELVKFYESEEGQLIYSDRKVSIEPLFEILKSTFGIRTVPVHGREQSASFVLMCVFVYQIAVYRNCVMGVENPRHVKCMLGI